MTDEQMQKSWEQIQALEAEMKSAGAWVFSARLARSRTRPRSSGCPADEVVTTDGPFVEAKEHLAGFYIIEAPDLDAALGWASKVTRTDLVADRGLAVRGHGRRLILARSSISELIGRIFREESGRSVATLIRIFGDIDLAEDAVQEAFAVALRKWPDRGTAAEPGWLDHDDRAEPARSITSAASRAVANSSSRCAERRCVVARRRPGPCRTTDSA